MGPRAARRARRMAGVTTGARVLRVEDAFLRSLFPGRKGEPPLGLLIDEQGVYYDPATPNDLERCWPVIRSMTTHCWRPRG